MADGGIPRRKLGRTDIQITRLSLGGTGLGGTRTTDDDAVSAATVRRAVEIGIGHVDTAPAYFESERRVGIAVRQMGGLPEGVSISTKCRLLLTPEGRFSPEQTRASVERSLSRLGVDSVDILFMHSPASMDPVLAPGGMLDEACRMRDEGKFRWIGLGTRSHEHHLQAIRSGRVDVIMTFADYNLVRQSAAPLMAEASAAGVGVVLAQAYLFGILAGDEPLLERYDVSGKIPTKWLVPDVAPGHDWWTWARDRGLSLRAVALQYCLRNPNADTVLVGADSPVHVEQNVAALSEPIPESVWEEVEERVAAGQRQV